MADSKADAPFVFEGSVKEISASNVPAVPADAKTVIVQVDHVRQAPRALAGFAGKEITVRLAANEKLAAGDKATFFTDSLVFGNTLAVQSLGHQPVVAVEAKAALAGAAPVAQKLRQRIDQADSVVSGQVMEVHPYAPAAVRAAVAGATAMPGGPISEHAPLWQEAVIQVSKVHKGPAQKKVMVRFPASNDVRWRRAPHFKKGQQGTWLLHSAAAAPVAAKAATAPATAKLAKAAAPAEIYTALDPNDFHSPGEASMIQAMLPTLAAAHAVKKKVAAQKKAGAKAAAHKKPAAKKAAAKKKAAKARATKRH